MPFNSSQISGGPVNYQILAYYYDHKRCAEKIVDIIGGEITTWVVKRVVEAYEKQNATIAFIRNQLRGQPYDVILLKMALFLQWADQKRPQHAIDFQTDMFAIFGFELDRTALEIWQRLQPFLTKMHEGSVKRSLLLIYKSECRCRNVEFVEFMLKHQTRIRIEKLKGADRVRQDPRYAGEPMFDLYAFHDKPTGGIIPTWFPEDERNMTYLPRLG